MLQKPISRFRNIKSKQLSAALVVLAVAAIGTYLIVGSHAATPYASLNVDNGTTADGATKQACAGASNGNCVAFGSVPKHVETWAYDDYVNGYCNGGEGASAALVQKWLSYAETSCGPESSSTKALTDCHANGIVYCKVMAYLDTNRIYPTGGSAPITQDAQENWWLHAPVPNQANRLTLNSYGGGYILNQSVTAVDQWFQNYIRASFPDADGLFMDDSGDSIVGVTGGTGYTSSYELTTDAQVTAEHTQMASYLTHADGTPYLQVDNAVDTWPIYPQGFRLLNAPDGVAGLTAEGAPMSNGVLNNDYPYLLDDMSYTDNNTSGFMVLLAYDTSGSSTQSLTRRVQAATVLLGYSPGHIVSWSNVEQNNLNLGVWPEEGIYPTQPVQSMTTPSGTDCLTGNFNGAGSPCTSGGHNDIRVANGTYIGNGSTDFEGGVFRREFKECYNQGVAFGPCATIVNDTSSAVTVQSSWLTQTYTHQITMVGGDVQSGGTVDLTGAGFTPGSTTIAASDAIILTP